MDEHESYVEDGERQVSDSGDSGLFHFIDGDSSLRQGKLSIKHRSLRMFSQMFCFKL